MAAKLQIHAPYVLQTLPRPLDGPDRPGRYLAGEVFGQKEGGKRRKRTELSVAVDGIAVYIYDIVSSHPVTSYLVSPQSSFTCAPYSLRWRPAESKTATRFTYVSLSTHASSSSKQEIKLFREESSGTGETTVASASHALRCKAPIVQLFATSSRGSATSLPSDGSSTHDVVAVASDGTILCLNGETLQERWQVSPSVFSKELLTGPRATELQIGFAQQTSAADVVDGMFGGQNELFGVFQEKIHRDGFNPDILVAITWDKVSNAWYLHIFALPSEKEARQANNERLIPVFAAPLPAEAGETRYQLDARSGTLQTLAGGAIATYSFDNGIPRFENKLQAPAVASSLRLSKTAVLTSAADCFSIYNPIYRSLQATVALDPSTLGGGSSICDFVTYFSSRETAVGLRGADLVAVQIEAPKNRNNKRRAEGLLSDAIRRGLSRGQSCQKLNPADHPASAVLADPLPATEPEWQRKSAEAEELLRNNKLRSWEELLAGVFRVPVKLGDGAASSSALTNSIGHHPNSLLEWVWPSSRTDYPRIDRRWIFYAISRIFVWGKQGEGSDRLWLTCRLPESNVLNYLVDAGHLSTSNMKSAFKDEVWEVDEAEEIIGEDLPVLLAQIDPTMELLLGYLSGTQLGSTELVSSIKVLLHSLGLFEDSAKVLQMRLMENGEGANEQETDAVNMELDRAEEELQITEHYLGGHRARGLGVAFGKLAACPAASTVRSLRRLFKAEEVIGLMNVLRAELIKDGWTTRYLDRTGADQDEVEAPPDGSIQLIADLMSRCIDSVGLGGWMASDTMLASSRSQDDSADFFNQFQAEVSVALEGIMEAVKLQGTLAEFVGYAKRARKGLGSTMKAKDVSLHLSEALPLGLKTDIKVSTERVRSGGEIVARSSRQIGHFISKKRGTYSVHRISEETLLGGAGATIVQEAR